MVPTESQVSFPSHSDSWTNLRNVASAAGDLQMLPQHTNKMCMQLDMTRLSGFLNHEIIDLCLILTFCVKS